MARTRSRKCVNITNGTTPSPRRSRCPRKTRITTSPGNLAVRRSARLASKSRTRAQQQETTSKKPHGSSTHEDRHDSSATTKETPTVSSLTVTRKPHPKLFSYIDDTTSESGSSSSFSATEYDSDTEGDSKAETKHFYTDNLHSAASNTIDDYKGIYKSWRGAEDNECEFDEFVLWDGEVNEEVNREEGDSDRKASFSSTSSEDTLFVPELKVKKRKHANEQEPEDVAEQISDAIVLFLRRCNRDLKPAVLRVTKSIRRHKEVAAVWDRAVRSGLGAGTEMSDGSVVWRIGPKVVRGVL